MYIFIIFLHIIFHCINKNFLFLLQKVIQHLSVTGRKEKIQRREIILTRWTSRRILINPLKHASESAQTNNYNLTKNKSKIDYQLLALLWAELKRLWGS